MKTTFIYVLKEPESGEVRYVGKADCPRERLAKHLRLSSGQKNHREAWIFSLLLAGRAPDLEIVDEVPSQNWGFFERAYIKVWREAGANLVNATDGGDCGPCRAGKNHYAFGKSKTLETRRKISEALKGKPQPGRGREGRRAWNKGREMPVEQREKLSAALMGDRNPNFGKKFPGRVRSEGSKAKTSASLKLAWVKRKNSV